MRGYAYGSPDLDYLQINPDSGSAVFLFADCGFGLKDTDVGNRLAREIELRVSYLAAWTSGPGD